MLIELLGTLKGEVDVGTDILLAKELVEARLVEYGLHLLVHTREYHLNALGLRHETEVREVGDSRWDRYLGMTAAMTQVPVPMTIT